MLTDRDSRFPWSEPVSMDFGGARWTHQIGLLTGRFGVRVPGGAPTRTGPSGPVLLRSARHRAIATPRQQPVAGLPGHRRATVVTEALTARPSPRPLGSQRIHQIRVGSLRSPPAPGALLARRPRSRPSRPSPPVQQDLRLARCSPATAVQLGAAQLDRPPPRVQPALEPLRQLSTGDETPILVVRTELQFHATLPEGNRARAGAAPASTGDARGAPAAAGRLPSPPDPGVG